MSLSVLWGPGGSREVVAVPHMGTVSVMLQVEATRPHEVDLRALVRTWDVIGEIGEVCAFLEHRDGTAPSLSAEF